MINPTILFLQEKARSSLYENIVDEVYLYLTNKYMILDHADLTEEEYEKRLVETIEKTWKETSDERKVSE